MKRWTGGGCYWSEAVITVFFTLVSVLFLGVLFMLIESARLQGARAQTANITDMGNLSVFGEFEKKLLADYEVFAVDGSYGSGDFAVERINGRLMNFLEQNANPAADGLLTSLCFDPWQVSLKESTIHEYALLSDGGGENYYQQAVAYMRETALLQASGTLLESYRRAALADQQGDIYEKEKYASDRQMEQVEQQESEAKAQEQAIREQQSASGEIVPIPYDPEAQIPRIENPLPALGRLAGRDILKVVCGKAPVSKGAVGRKDLASKRRLRKGNLKTKRPYGGLMDHLLFREYLLDRFPCWSEPAEEGELKYGIEYILGGKRKDKDNLRAVVKRLLWLREGCNYMYSVGDAEMNRQTEMMAMALVGWMGIPQLTAVMKHALLLGWSYGESLLDVRTLMDGGRVPLFKKEGDWELELEQLARINDKLETGRKSRDRGQDYRDYLRMLLNLQFISTQKKRGLDLVELYVKSGNGLSHFRVDNCVVAMRDETIWNIPPLFSRVSSIWLGGTMGTVEVTVKGGYAYQ